MFIFFDDWIVVVEFIYNCLIKNICDMKQKIYLVLYLTFLSVSLLSSCDNQSFDEMDTINSNFDLEDDYSELKEFKEYKSSYAKFDLLVKDILKNTSKEDIEEITNLFFQYMENPTDYEVLLEYKVKKIVGKNATLLNNMYQELMIKKEKLILTKSFALLNEGDRIKLSGQLSVVNSEPIDDFPRIKTRSEGNDCVRRCAEQRDIAIKAADMIAYCATAFNTATCLATAGASAATWWVAEFGIAAARDIAVHYAHESYDACVRGC